MVKTYRLLLTLGIIATSSLGLRLLTGPAKVNAAQVNTDATTQQNVVYSKVDGQDLAVDIFGISPNQKKPAIIFLHGGGWVGGSRKDMTTPANYFAQNGYVTFTVSYRLVKDEKSRYPAQIDDVQRAVRWIRAHATEYGVNPDKIGVLGASAGGHLAALLGTTDTLHNDVPELKDFSSRVQCVVDLYGPTDFSAFIDAPVTDAAQHMEGVKLVTGFLGPLPENAANYREASPASHVDKKTVPFLIFHGGKDALVPVAQSQLLNEKLKKEGIETKLVVFPEAGHGYTETNLLLQTVTEASAFFDRHLKK